MNNEVIILLSEIEAKKWVTFQKHYDLFMLLVEKGVFDQKNGSVALHFDSVGNLQTIQRADILYSKKHSLTNN
jgi:hypothetical protein